MDPIIEPTVSAYSPLFELRAWRRELDRMVFEYAEDAAAMARINEARREVDAWIRDRERSGGSAGGTSDIEGRSTS